MLKLGRYAPSKIQSSHLKSVVKQAWLALRLGKCVTCACLPILFGGMAQKLYKITVLKGDFDELISELINVQI